MYWLGCDAISASGDGVLARHGSARSEHGGGREQVRLTLVSQEKVPGHASSGVRAGGEAEEASTSSPRMRRACSCTSTLVAAQTSTSTLQAHRSAQSAPLPLPGTHLERVQTFVAVQPRGAVLQVGGSEFAIHVFALILWRWQRAVAG